MDNYDKIIRSLTYGLTANGEANKQYWLEQAFRDLCGDTYVDKAKETLKWKDSEEL